MLVMLDGYILTGSILLAVYQNLRWVHTNQSLNAAIYLLQLLFVSINILKVKQKHVTCLRGCSEESKTLFLVVQPTYTEHIWSYNIITYYISCLYNCI